MIPVLFILASSVVLRDDVNAVPPDRWRYERFVTKEQLPVGVDCVFKVVKGPPVRVELMTADNLEALRRGEQHEFIAASESGDLHQEIGVPGTFAIVVINSDKEHAADVSLRLSLDFSAKSLKVTGELSPQKKLVVALLSFTGFLAIVSFSARKLIRAMRDSRATNSRPPIVENAVESGPDRDSD
jgi:hypothetical protein